jgi:hypothetical protein
MALLVSVASPAAGSPAPSISQCIDRDARWSALDDHRILASSTHQTFLATAGSCPRLNAPLTHIVVSVPGGTPICGPHDVRLYITDGGGIRTPCTIESISPLSQDEARALRAARR